MVEAGRLFADDDEPGPFAITGKDSCMFVFKRFVEEGGRHKNGRTGATGVFIGKYSHITISLFLHQFQTFLDCPAVKL